MAGQKFKWRLSFKYLFWEVVWRASDLSISKLLVTTLIRTESIFHIISSPYIYVKLLWQNVLKMIISPLDLRIMAVLNHHCEKFMSVCGTWHQQVVLAPTKSCMLLSCIFPVQFTFLAFSRHLNTTEKQAPSQFTSQNDWGQRSGH